PEVTPTPATKVEKQPIPEVKVPEVTTIPATKVEKQPIPEVKIPEVKSTPVASPPVAAEAKVTETEESNLPSETMENPKSQFQE
ncbi:MAG: hypothetical protein HUM72_24665, partial [Dolichospermum sp.]|nr:hypothetical protein [Dolichospermum sp.]